MSLSVIFSLLLFLSAIFGGVFLLRVYRPIELPPTRNRGRRLLPVLSQSSGVLRKSCQQCYFFEKTGFGDLARRAPAAAEAARWLSPTAMAKTEKGGWDESSGFDKEGQPIALGGPQWEDVGTCHARPGVMTFPENQCEKWR